MAATSGFTTLCTMKQKPEWFSSPLISTALKCTSTFVSTSLHQRPFCHTQNLPYSIHWKCNHHRVTGAGPPPVVNESGQGDSLGLPRAGSGTEWPSSPRGWSTWAGWKQEVRCCRSTVTSATVAQSLGQKLIQAILSYSRGGRVCRERKRAWPGPGAQKASGKVPRQRPESELHAPILWLFFAAIWC